MQSTHARTAMQALLASPPALTRPNTPASRPRIAHAAIPGPRTRTTPPPANLATSHHPSLRLSTTPSTTMRTHLIDVLYAGFVPQLLGFPMTPKTAVSASLPSPPLPASRAMQSTHPRRAWLALPPLSAPASPGAGSPHHLSQPQVLQQTRSRTPATRQTLNRPRS